MNLALTARGRSGECFWKHFDKLIVPVSATAAFFPFMNKFRHALCVILVATTCALRAADKEDDDNPLGDFMPTNDDLVQYVPKYSMKLGFRAIGGVHATFSGQGAINLGLLPSKDTLDQENLNRTYHDGSVNADATTKVDPSGGTSSNSQPGLTNSWGYASSSQIKYSGTGTDLAMHDYATTLDPVDSLKQNPSTSLGVELTGERDMGKIFNTRAHWGVIVGFAVNQISAIREIYEPGTLTTTTDLYRVQPNTLPYGSVGTTLPAAPYTSSSTSVYQIDLSNTPVDGRTTTTTNVDIQTRWRLRGAYVTFRAGPTLTVPITGKLSANVSAGALLLYMGTTYDVDQKFMPATGDAMETTVSDGASAVLPGFYMDASLQYAMTENSGMYVGGVVQTAQTYTQTIKSTDDKSDFKAKVDFANMEGVKAGFLFKF